MAVRVLIVARPRDHHGDAVEAVLREQAVDVSRISLNVMQRTEFSWDPSPLLELKCATSEPCRIDQTTTIWWRRPGWVDAAELQADEQELAEAEIGAIFRGALAACRARWVDEPSVVELAENKLVQLATAHRSGIRTPHTVVTNSIQTARAFIRTRPIVCKPVSAGAGLAPFVDEVPEQYLETVAEAPVLLQERIEATADLRVVTVGSRAFVWRRQRLSGASVDWRRDDPVGGSFVHAPGHIAAIPALTIARALGLSHSSQDWLETSEGPVFLEANPAGQWLFLAEAESLVLPAITSLLLGSAA